MSFGFSTEKSDVSSAITLGQRARQNKILYFAAANNDGRGARELFPAAQFANVISVRGTDLDDDFATAAKYNPQTEDGNTASLFGTLAKDEDAIWSRSLPMEGCSIATPFLAATAALFLQYVSYLGNVDPNTRGLLERFYEKRHMVELFDKVGVHQSQGRVFVSPIRLFERDLDLTDAKVSTDAWRKTLYDILGIQGAG